LKLLFSLFDTDHDGRITQDEVKQLVETASGHPWTEEQLTAFMQTVDTDSKYKLILFDSLEYFYVVSGDINIDEFTVMMNKYVPTSTLGLRDLFNTFGKRRKIVNVSCFFLCYKNKRF
jgi:Ca2+-binding EF-hand superfamily protein